MMTLLLTLIIGTVVSMVIYGVRIELVYKVRNDALDTVYRRIQALLAEATGTTFDDLAALEAEIERQWGIFHQHSYNGMLLALTKWSFAHFYPELADELAEYKKPSTLE